MAAIIRRKIAGHKALVTTTENKLRAEMNKDEPDIAVIKMKAESLTKTWVRMEGLFEELFVHEEDTAAISDEYSQTESRVQTLLEESRPLLAPRNSGASSPTQPVNVGAQVKLPSLKLPRFDGREEAWPSFWDQFSSAIHDRGDIPTVSKFAYLRDALTGRALKLVSNFDTNEQNYKEAIDLLKTTYDNPERIRSETTRKLLNLRRPRHDAEDLADFRAELEAVLRQLSNIKVDVTTDDNLASEVVLSKLSEETVREIQRLSQKQYPRLPTIREKLLTVIQNLTAAPKSVRPKSEYKPQVQKHPQSNHKSKSSVSINSVQANGQSTANAASTSSNTKKRPCLFCQDAHLSSYCTKYATLEERQGRLRTLKLCANCCVNHAQDAECKLGECYRCRKAKHHVTLCPEVLNTVTVSASVKAGKTSCVPVLRLQINHRNNNCHNYALLDTGSQRTFVRRSVVDSLGLKRVGRVSLTVEGFVGTCRKDYEVVEITVKIGRYYLKIKALATDKLPENIRMSGITEATQFLNQHLQLADPDVSSDEFPQVDLLIGSDYYFKIVRGHANFEGIDLIKTAGGLVVSGTLPQQFASAHAVQASAIVSNISTRAQIESWDLAENQLANLWKLESIGVKSETNTPEERLTEKLFQESIEYKDSQYWVRLPWRQSPDMLPTNRDLSYNRTKHTYKKLIKSNQLASFQQVLESHENMNFIEPVSELDTSTEVHYLPLLCVHKESSTTPLRIVYDCSAKASNSYLSLNECLYTGPSLTEQLVSSLIKFRINPWGFISDISKAFLRVGLKTEDRNFTRFFLPKHNTEFDQDLQEYRFKSVLFGSSSSPYLLQATLNHHLNVIHKGSPTAQILSQSLYVDNIQGAANSEESLINFYHSANALMEQAAMPLQSWNSNSPALRSILESQQEGECDRIAKVLGVVWDMELDNIQCRPVTVQSIMTKRQLVSEGGKLFDPLGLLAPITIRVKILIQSSWELKLGWDDCLPKTITGEWEKLAKDLSVVEHFTVPRMVASEGSHYELHMFCDASPKAYGAVAYLVENGICVKFVMSKARVAPLKERTLPQLELLGVLVAAQMASYLTSTLAKVSIRNTFIWCDSEIAIQWTLNHKSTIVFVRNRVEQIKELVPQAQMRYVGSRDNPADLLTRGLSFHELVESAIWTEGPPWLTDSQNWPDSKFASLIGPSILACPVAVVNRPEPLLEIENYSQLNKLIRVTALVMKFVSKCSKGRFGNTPPLDYWVKITQGNHHANIIQQLENDDRGDKEAADLIRKLKLRLHGGAIVSEGRLKHADMESCSLYPSLLPKNSHLAKLVILKAHESTLHRGVADTLRKVREMFWIPQGRQRIKSVIKGCWVCKRLEGPRYTYPDPPHLPSFRVKEQAPFSTVGVDLAGPLILQDNPEAKLYICLFTCASTRAIHLELLEDMTAEMFIIKLRAFIARRSCPKLIISDNAKTFQAASQFLTHIFNTEDIQDELRIRNITWRFIPARSAWFGGFYERLIGSVKGCLRKVLYKRKVTLPELATILIEIEARINNRPLTYQSDDPYELSPLTPAHLLYGRPIDTSPLGQEDPGYEPSSDHLSLNERYKFMSGIIQKWYGVWKTDYLLSLRERFPRGNKATSAPVVKVGDVVLIHNEKKREDWSLGKVVKLLPDSDGVTRVAKLNSKHGSILRAIKLLYPLECSVSHDNSDNRETSHEDPSPLAGSSSRPTDESQSQEVNQNNSQNSRDREPNTRRRSAQACREWLSRVCQDE